MEESGASESDFPQLPATDTTEPWARWTATSLRDAMAAQGLCEEDFSVRKRKRVYAKLRDTLGGPDGKRGRKFVKKANLRSNPRFSFFSSDSEAATEEDRGAPQEQAREAGRDEQPAAGTSASDGRGDGVQSGTSNVLYTLTSSDLKQLIESCVSHVPGQVTRPQRLPKKSDLPTYEHANVPAWLDRLERALRCFGLEENDFLPYLSLVAEGLAAKVLYELDAENYSYIEAKKRILRLSGHSRGEYRRKFLDCMLGAEESHDAFASRLRSYLNQWLDAPRSEHERVMHERILIPRFIEALPANLRASIYNSEPKSLDEASRKADYVKVMVNSASRPQSNAVPGPSRSHNGGENPSQRSRKMRGKNGWRTVPYRKRGNGKGPNQGPGASNPQVPKGNGKPGAQGKGAHSGKSEPPKQRGKPNNKVPGAKMPAPPGPCFGCGGEGHWKRECPVNPPSMGLLLALPAADERASSRFQGKCLLNGQPATCRIDTQAGVTFVKSTKLGNATGQGSVTVRAFGSRPTSYPCCQVTVALPTVCRTVRAGVFQPKHLDVDVLIGQDVLEHATRFLSIKECANLRWASQSKSRPSDASAGSARSRLGSSDRNGEARMGGPAEQKPSATPFGELQVLPAQALKRKSVVEETGEVAEPMDVSVGKATTPGPTEVATSRPTITEAHGVVTTGVTGTGSPSGSACESLAKQRESVDGEETSLPPPGRIRELQAECPSLVKTLSSVGQCEARGNARFVLSAEGVCQRRVDPDFPRLGKPWGEGPRVAVQTVLPRALI